MRYPLRYDKVVGSIPDEVTGIFHWLLPAALWGWGRLSL